MNAVTAATTPPPSTTAGNTPSRRRAALRVVLITLALGYVGLFLLLPLLAVFTQALSKGLDAYRTALIEPDALSAAEENGIERALGELLRSAVTRSASGAASRS